MYMTDSSETRRIDPILSWVGVGYLLMLVLGRGDGGSVIRLFDYMRYARTGAEKPSLCFEHVIPLMMGRCRGNRGYEGLLKRL